VAVVCLCLVGRFLATVLHGWLLADLSRTKKSFSNLGKGLFLLGRLWRDHGLPYCAHGLDAEPHKKGLAYCWSVAIVAFPDEGKERFEKLLADEDKNIGWIIKENLKKERLKRMDPEWTELMKQRTKS
jgi:hypothetical protein